MTVLSSSAVPTQRLHLCLEHGPGKSIPAHTWGNSGLAVAGTRPDSDMATSSCPSRAAAGRGPTVEWPLIAARVRATSVPACYVAPDHHPSLDVGQSRPMASAFARGWAAAEFGLSPAAAPNLGPSRPVRVRRSSPACWLARPVRGLSTLGRVLTAGRRPGCWALTAGLGGALLARRLALGR